MSKGLEGRIKLNTEEPRKQLRSLETTREEYVDVSKGREEPTARASGVLSRLQ